MAPEHRTVIHISRGGWLAIGLIALLPWLGVVLLLRPRGAPAPAPAAPASPRTAAAASRARPGPWGDLEYTSITIEPPEDFIPERYLVPQPIRWVFKGQTAESLAALWRKAGLTAAQQEALNQPGRRQVVGDSLVLQPDVELVRALEPSARAAIYAVLASELANEHQHDPYRFRTESVDDWFTQSNVAAEVLALTRRLSYQRNGSVLFSDPDVVLPLLPSPADRVRYVKTLSRKLSLLVQLHVAPESDVEALGRYWGSGRRSKDLLPLLQSLARRPGGGSLDIVHLLPPFPRLLLYTYPLPSENPSDLARDCHWTSLNFYHDQPDERMTDLAYKKHVLSTEYYPVAGEPQLGDVIMLVQSGDRAIHSCVYIADDIVFTKNGAAFSVPWQLARLDNVVAFYSWQEPVELRRYRAKPSPR